VAERFRWKLADDDGGQPMLFDEDELVDRHVGKGEFRGLEFLHVNAKRIINEVPGASRMPFRFTINAYRGCSHACVYCMSGDTPVLLADGRTRRLERVRPGDAIVGTKQGRLVETEVLAHWSTTKRAQRVVLDDGTELVASADHRFRAPSGWLHVAELRVGDALLSAISAGESSSGDGLRAKQVASVEDLGTELAMYDITTGTGDFMANGVVSHNCFARPTHEYLDLDMGEDFERKLVVKVNAVERLRAELRSPKWQGDHIAMGTNTDPYQRAEGKYHLTRGIVQALGEAANPFSILTKSTLILRDIDVLTAAAERTDVRASFSIGTLDTEVWRLSEPGTPHPRKRVEAVARLNAAGIPTGVLVAPVLPGLSDRPDQVEEVVAACVEAGAVSIGSIYLHLRPGVKEHFMTWLADRRPDLVAEYATRYRRSYLPKDQQQQLTKRVSATIRRHGGLPASPRSLRTVGHSAAPATPSTPPPPPLPPPEQLSFS
jgi:DNA repair photolyase